MKKFLTTTIVILALTALLGSMAYAEIDDITPFSREPLNK